MDKKPSGWRVAAAALWARAAPVLGKCAALLALYLDDLLMVGAGVCFTVAALELGGRPAGLLTAGACLLGYAVVIAKAGGGRRGG